MLVLIDPEPPYNEFWWLEFPVTGAKISASVTEEITNKKMVFFK